METLAFESVGTWIKTGGVWTHLFTGAQRHEPPEFTFHVAVSNKPKKVRACDIEGVFVLGKAFDRNVRSVLIGTIEGMPITCVLDDNVLGALRTTGLVDNADEL